MNVSYAIRGLVNKRHGSTTAGDLVPGLNFAGGDDGTRLSCEIAPIKASWGAKHNESVPVILGRHADDRCLLSRGIVKALDQNENHDRQGHGYRYHKDDADDRANSLILIQVHRPAIDIDSYKEDGRGPL